MDRPALQDLLQDLKAGRIDVVVVYKTDRLTRSLMDFAKIVEVFELAHSVPCVSHAAVQQLPQEGISVADLARELGLDDGEISRVLSLAFLAPDIIAAVLNGRQPIELTTKHLKRLKPQPLSWAEQRRRLGFPPGVQLGTPQSRGPGNRLTQTRGAFPLVVDPKCASRLLVFSQRTPQ